MNGRGEVEGQWMNGRGEVEGQWMNGRGEVEGRWMNGRGEVEGRWKTEAATGQGLLPSITIPITFFCGSKHRTPKQITPLES